MGMESESTARGDADAPARRHHDPVRRRRTHAIRRLYVWLRSAGVTAHSADCHVFQRSGKKLMQHSADDGYDRRQIHPRGGGDDHVISLA